MDRWEKRGMLMHTLYYKHWAFPRVQIHGWL
jgi:hypothetical protein